MAKRMFVAIDLPGDVAGRLASLDPGIEGLRWMPAERLHLTLCFLGIVSDDGEQSITAALAHPPFSLSIKGLGRFGGRGGIIVWAGVEDPQEDLRVLSGTIAAAAREAGIPTEGKALHPHITVGRSRPATPPGLRQFLQRHADRDFGRFHVTGISLYSSILTPEGPEYRKEFQRSFAPTPR